MLKLVAAAIGLCLLWAQPASALLVYQRSATHEIVAARDNGSQPHVIARGFMPTIAPDRRQVAFITIGRRNDPYDGKLRIVSARGGRARSVAPRARIGLQPHLIAWSPDSRYVTVGRVGGEQWVVDLAKGTRRAVAISDYPGQSSFSPDGSRLLVEGVRTAGHEADDEINVVRTRGGAAHELAAGEGPAWGADGFAYRDYSRGIVFERHVGSKPRLIRAGGQADPLDWAADGDTLLAVRGTRALLIDRHTRRTEVLHARFSAIDDLSRSGRVVLGERAGDAVAAWRDGTVRVLARNATEPNWSK